MTLTNHLLRNQALQDHFDSIHFGSEEHRSKGKQYAAILGRIEQFVDAAVDGQISPIPALTDDLARRMFRNSGSAESHLGWFNGYQKLIDMLPDDYRYAESVELFKYVKSELSHLPLTAASLPKNIGLKSKSETPLENINYFNAFVEHLRTAGRDKRYRERKRNRQRECDERYREYRQYVKDLFSHWARLIVLRVDFHYEKNDRGVVDLSTASKDLDHLLANRRNNSLFRGLRGYIAKIEYGVGRQVHIHTLWFFDGSIRDGERHGYLAQSIGEYWKTQITNNFGNYWNSNAKIQVFNLRNTCGIGDIKYSDGLAIHNLNEYVVKYLCKKEQYVRPANKTLIKLYRRGLLTRSKSMKRGRPRKLSSRCSEGAPHGS